VSQFASGLGHVWANMVGDNQAEIELVWFGLTIYMGQYGLVPTVSSQQPQMKTKIFGYRESFSRLYRDSGVNENENDYKKYENKSSIFIRI